MKKKFNGVRFKKMAKILQVIMSVFYWSSIVGMIISVITIPAVFAISQGDLTMGHLISIVGSVDSADLKFNSANGISFFFPKQALPLKADLTKVFLLIVSTFFVYCLSLTVLFKQIRGILKTIATDTPFEENNSKRLLRIGKLLIASSIVFNVLTSQIFTNLIKIFDVKNFNISSSIDMFMFLTGILMLILSGVFKYGAYLQNEYDTTL